MLKGAASLIKGRLVSFEVYGGREGRWTIDGVLADEDQAIDYARNMLKSGRWDEVKVVRQRSMLSGFGTESVIFHEKKPEVKDKPITISAKGSAEVGACTSIDEFFTFEGRLAVGRLLRQFLDKFRITPTELLHGYTYLRKLTETGNLTGTALHHVARAQTAGTDTPVKQRIAQLEAMVYEGIKRARDMQAEKKKLPKFDPDNLAHTSARVRATVGPDRHDYVLLSLLTEHLTGSTSIGGKLETVLGLVADDLDPALVRLLEGVIADTLGTAEMVKDLLGPHPNLGSGLCTLADFLHGRLIEENSTVSPLLLHIGRLVRAGKAPYCRVILIERLRQSINQDQALDHRDPTKDAMLLKDLAERLKDDRGQRLGGSMVEKALVNREIRNRQALLRAQGMHDVADALPKHYQPTIL